MLVQLRVPNLKQQEWQSNEDSKHEHERLKIRKMAMAHGSAGLQNAKLSGSQVKAHKRLKKWKWGSSCLAFDKARCRVFICRLRQYDTEYSMLRKK